MPTINANGITVNYELEGPQDAELVVLINGLADDRTTWAAQLPALQDAGYRVLSYDNRGIGLTSRPEGPYTAALLADDLHVLLTALGITRAHFVGVSMGGMILQSYALRFPSPSAPGTGTGAGTGTGTGIAILSLTLACTYAQPTAFCARLFALWADMARRMGVRDVMRDVTLWAFTVPFFRTRTAELEAVERAMAELDMGLLEYLSQLEVIRRFDATGHLAGLRSEGRWFGGVEPRRVMVLAGKVDILIPVTLSRELSELIEGSVFKTVKGGHGCMWEFPDAFNEAVIDHLKECSKQSSV